MSRRVFQRSSLSDLIDIAIGPINEEFSINLNPGKDYTIRSNDILYYISIRKDEYYRIKEYSIKT